MLNMVFLQTMMSVIWSAGQGEGHGHHSATLLGTLWETLLEPARNTLSYAVHTSEQHVTSAIVTESHTLRSVPPNPAVKRQQR